MSFSLTPCSHAHRSTRARAALLSLSIAHISRSRPLSCSHSLVIGNCYTAPGHSPAARSPYHFIHSSSIACTMSLSPLLASRSFGGRDTRAVCRSAASHPGPRAGGRGNGDGGRGDRNEPILKRSRENDLKPICYNTAPPLPLSLADTTLMSTDFTDTVRSPIALVHARGRRRITFRASCRAARWRPPLGGQQA